MSRPRVLIVDDEPRLRTMLQTMLQTMGFYVVTAATCPEALVALTSHPPDAVVMDLHLEQDCANWLGQHIRATSPVPVILMTGGMLSDDEVAGAQQYACEILYKPFDMTTLVSAVHACLHAPAR